MPKPAQFWNDRFAAEEFVYGEAPNQFVAAAAEAWLPDAPDVLTLGAGEGRNAVHLARQGHAVTALDYSTEGLAKTRRLADAAGVTVDPLHADVRSWTPDRTWDAVVTTFLHLPPDERPAFYRLIQQCLRPGGLLVAEWFRPEQRTDGYTSGGPPEVDMMVTADELREHFAADGIERLSAETPVLDEGPHHSGPAATVRVVWRKTR